MRLLIYGRGESVHVQRWAAWMAADGIEVHLAAHEREVPPLPGVRIHSLRPRGGFRGWRVVRRVLELRRLVARVRPDVIHAHWAAGRGWMVWLTRFHPIVIKVQGSDVFLRHRQPRPARLLLRLALRSADLVVVGSSALGEESVRAGARPDRVAVVHGGVRAAALACDRRGRPSTPVVLAPRGSRPIYQAGTLLRAARLLRDVLPAVRYLVVADPRSPHTGDLRRLSAELGVDDVVEFLPPVPHEEIAALYGRADVLVSTPASDSASVAVVEGMASGLVPVVSDLPAMREWVGDGDNGLLVPSGDVRALADAIARAVTDPALALRCQTENPRLAAARADYDAQMARIAAQYRRLASARPAAPEPDADAGNMADALLRGAGATLLGNGALFAMRFLFAVLAARLLGIEGYGLFTLALTISTLVEAIGALGLNAGIVRFVAVQAAKGAGRAARATIAAALALGELASLAASLLLFAVAPLLSAHLFHRPDLVAPLRLLAPIVPVAVGNQLLTNGLQGLKLMGRRSLVNTLQVAVRLAAFVMFARLGWGVNAAIAAYGVSMLTGASLAAWWLRRGLAAVPVEGSADRNGETRNGDGPLLSPLVRFSLPHATAEILDYAMTWSDLLLLGVFGVLADVGAYNAAGRLAALGGMFYISLKPIFAPLVSESFPGGTRRVETLLQTATRWGLLSTLPVYLLFFLTPDLFLRAFGADFVGAALPLAILSVGQLANVGTGPVGQVLLMTGRSTLALVNTVLFLGLTLGLDLFLIPRFGIVGAASATAGSAVLANVIQTVQVRVIYRIHPYGRGVWKPMAAGMIALGVGALVRTAGRLPALLAFLAVYLLALRALGIDPEDTRTVANLIRNVRSTVRGVTRARPSPAAIPGGQSTAGMTDSLRARAPTGNGR